MRAAFPETRDRSRRIGEDPRRVYDPGILRSRERHLDDVDSEQRCRSIRQGYAARTARQLGARSNRSGSGDVDVNVRRIVGISHQRVRVRAAACLNGGNLLRMIHVGDVEDPDTAESFGAYGVGDSLCSAVNASARFLHREEEQILVDGRIALTARANQ